MMHEQLHVAVERYLMASTTWAQVLATAVICSWLLHWANACWHNIVGFRSKPGHQYNTIPVASRQSTCESHPKLHSCTFLSCLHGNQGQQCVVVEHVEGSLHVFHQTVLAGQTVLPGTFTMVWYCGSGEHVGESACLHGWNIYPQWTLSSYYYDDVLCNCPGCIYNWMPVINCPLKFCGSTPQSRIT